MANSATASSASSRFRAAAVSSLSSEIFGGAIPRQFVPAVEKGVQESAARGFLAGYPVVDFGSTVFDGSYHDVDSSELAFKTGRPARASARAWNRPKPALLEPVMRVEIEVPDECAGAVMGDLNSRRGRVQGMETAGRARSCAPGPLAEILSYGMTLTSMTQGQRQLPHGDGPLRLRPAAIAEKIAASAKHHVAADGEE